MVDGRNICVIVSQLSYGGAERQTTVLVETLAQQYGIRPVVCCMSPILEPFGSRIRQAGCELVYWDRGSSFELRRVRLLRQLLKTRDIRLVHAVHYDPIAYGWLARLGLSRIAFVPSVRSTVHTPVLRKRIFYRAVLPRCPVVIANSQSGRLWLEQHYGVPREQVCVVPNGLDPRLTAASADRDAVRSQLDIPCQAPVVAFVGKNARHKGLPLLERIFRRVLDVRPDAHLILIGEGLTNAWVQDSFGFHRAFHGLGTRDDVYDLIGAADCLVLTSTSEGFPNAVLEAMVLGVPPVATRVGECPIMIDHGVSGYLFDYDDDAEGARLLLDLINDPAKLAALSQQARSVALERYGTKAMVDRTLDIYERALGRRLRTAPAVPEAS